MASRSVGVEPLIDLKADDRSWPIAEVRGQAFRPQIGSAIRAEAVMALAETPGAANEPERTK